MADEQDLQWNAGKMGIASADGITSRRERMSWTFSVEINNADLCNHIKEESHISSGKVWSKYAEYARQKTDRKQNGSASIVYLEH